MGRKPLQTSGDDKSTISSQNKRSELAQYLADELNKSSKEGKVAYFLNDEEDPSMVSDWVSTGSSLLDLAISNRKDGGCPSGRITVLTGLESAGKSLICAHLIANTQKKNGIGVYIDTENAAAPTFWTALGVDLNDMVYQSISVLEDVFEKIEEIILKVRKNNKSCLVTIILDSLAAATTKAEQEAGYTKDGYATSKSIITSKAMRKLTSLIAKQRIVVVFTNQLRMNLQAGPFGDKWIESCGKATSYHCSVKVRLSNVGKVKSKDDSKEPIGTSVKAIVTKNRMGPPYKSAEFNIYFDRGIADYESWVDVLKKFNIVQGKQAWLEYEGENYSKNDFINLLNTNVEKRTKLYDQMAEKLIMIYKSPNSVVETETETVADEETEILDENKIKEED